MIQNPWKNDSFKMYKRNCNKMTITYKKSTVDFLILKPWSLKIGSYYKEPQPCSDFLSSKNNGDVLRFWVQTAEEKILGAPLSPPPPFSWRFCLFATRWRNLFTSGVRRQLASASASTRRDCDRLRANHLRRSWKSVKIEKRSIGNTQFLIC